jgi:hypothetical protein
MAQALVALPLVMTVLGGAAQAGGTILSSNAQARELNLQADQLSTQAGSEHATSQRRAMEERRQARLASSRALALSAAGGGADDPSVINAIAGIDQEGEYRALTALYEGNDAAAGLEAEAAARRRGAKSTKTAGLIKAGSTILSAGSSLYSRYGA